MMRIEKEMIIFAIELDKVLLLTALFTEKPKREKNDSRKRQHCYYPDIQ